MDATVEYANLRAPIAVEEIEISQRWQLEPASATTLALARLHGEPLGLVILHPGDDPVDRVWDMFSARIEAHAAREDVV
ncbi:MAG TPA: hypothetical protein VGU02_06890, partial [Gaiellaceae bacterium]|nr:hypothetical protein [Gaiellaceae bacterium]